jgi:hypothetical protein
MSEGFRSEYPDEIERPKGILSREDVHAVIGIHMQNHSAPSAKPPRELSDPQGVYLCEVTVPGEKPGETIEYTYQRKGKFGNNQAAITTVSVTYYDADGMPNAAKNLANYDEDTGEWSQSLRVLPKERKF